MRLSGREVAANTPRFAGLASKVRDGSARIGVVGLGYVGLQLAVGFAVNFPVVGVDSDRELLDTIMGGAGDVKEVPRRTLQKALRSGLSTSPSFTAVGECDFILITVGTPLTARQDPDLSQVEEAAREIGKRLRPGMFVILESTTYPGTTEEVLVPILETSGLRAGRDFGVAYSPERIDPGSSVHRMGAIPKLVGGVDEQSTAVACALYRRVFKAVIPVSHARVAEAAKLLENVFRSVNIAFVNEMTLVMERLGINAWEVISAASTKPFGFMPFYPGPGIGGHCIPLDPYYLAYRSRKAGYESRFILLSGETNEYMKYHVVGLIHQGLREAGKHPAESSVALLGLAFKGNVSDGRESPSIRVGSECMRDGMRVRGYDPRVPLLRTPRGDIISETDANAAVDRADVAVIMTDHREFYRLDYDALSSQMRQPAVWVDARHVLKCAPRGSICLGVGYPHGRFSPHSTTVKAWGER